LNEFFVKEKIISGIVMFGATFYGPNKVVHNFKGDFILGNVYGARVEALDKTKELLSSSFNTFRLDNIKGAKYLKLFINLNNCLPAILGISLQEAFGDLELAKLAIQLNKETYGVMAKSNIELESLPSYPKERISGLVNMPTNEATGIFSKIMTNLSIEPLYGSILQSIKRGKKSEIDYINGEVVNLAGVAKMDAPLNRKIVGLVHKVEDQGKFLSKPELLSEIKGVIPDEEL
jgi:2-dehydropantoate 2-reductase